MTIARAVAALSLLTALVRPLGAQIGAPPSGRCRFILDNVQGSHLYTVKLPSGQYNS